MNFDLKHLLASLLNDRFDADAPRIPDGVCDLSVIITPLTEITRNGRAVRSDEPYHAADMMARVIDACIGDEPTVESLTNALLSMSILAILGIRAGCAIHPDMTPEEVLMDAADPVRLEQLAAEAATLECFEDPDGKMIPNLASLSVFADSTPISMAAIHGFIRRRLTPHLPYFFDDGCSDEDSTQTPPGPADERSMRKYEFVDDETMKNSTADPLEGFDEMLERFDETDYRRYELGEELDEILRDDPREPDDE
jgi:hypothetical protein